MIKQWQQFGFDNCSDSELKAWLKQTIPTIKKFLKVAESFCNHKQLSCENCEMKAKCGQFNKDRDDLTCLILESLISGRYKGTGYREKPSGLMGEFEDIESDDKTKFDKNDRRIVIRKKRQDIFKDYEECKELFSDNQWVVVYLYYYKCLTEKGIGEILGKTRSTISGILNNARKLKSAHDKKLREEMYQIKRKNLED